MKLKELKRSNWLVIIGIIVFLILIASMNLWIWNSDTIRIHATSGVNVETGYGISINYTVTNTTALNQISAQAVPTIVNGIIASTSIIIGFIATFSAIFIASFGQNDKRISTFVVAFVAIIPFPLMFVFFSLLNLSGGEWLFGLSMKLAWSAFLFSLFMVISIFIIATYIVHERQNGEDKKDKGNENGNSTPTHDQIRHAILSILYKKAETSSDNAINDEELGKILNVASNMLQFDVWYLEQEKLIQRDKFTEKLMITSSGVNIFEHKEENKNRLPFLNATIPIQIQNKIGLINL
jgi:hypothetical protein